MERITFDGNFCDIIMCHNEDGSSSCEKGTCDLKRTWERLKEIENILGKNYDLDRLKVLVNQSMTMREEVSERFSITKDIPVDRLRELVEADRDERCFISPAKIGEKVYHITTCKDFPKVYDGTLYDDDGGPGSATGLYCPCELAGNCPFPCDDDGSFDCEKHKNCSAVFEDVVDDIVIGDTMDFVGFHYSGAADFEEFGKYVFLDREFAEAALKGEQHDNSV